MPAITRAAYAVGGVLAALCLAGVALAPAGAAVPDQAFIRPQFFWPDILVALVYGGLGLYLAVRTGRGAGLALAVVGTGFAVSAVGIEWVLVSAGHDLPGQPVAAVAAATGWLTGVLCALLVLPWLVAPGPVDRAGRVGIVVGVSLVVAGTALRACRDFGGPEHPFAGPALSAWAEAAEAWTVPLSVAAGLGGALHLSVRLARSGPDERRALRWLVVAVVFLVLGYAAFETGLKVAGTSLVAAAPVLLVAQVILLAVVFALVAREEPWRVDLAVSRTVVATMLGGVVALAYLVLVWLGSRLLPWDGMSAGLLAVATLALAVAPLQRWLQLQVDRLVFGTGTDTAQLLVDLGRHLDASGGQEDLLDGLADGLRRGMRLRRVEIGSADPDGPRSAAGERGALQHTITLHNGGRLVGTLAIAPPAGQRLDPRTVGVLHQIAGLVAIALELATANRALDRARTRLVEVRQEERRLLRRELHDGLGPSLSGVALALRAIGNSSPLRPADAALLDQLCAELTRRADEVRQVARTLLPPSLEHGDLPEALEVLAARFSDDDFEVSIHVAGSDLLAGEQQVAIYHIAAEGVLNAHRHAGARRCVVRVVASGQQTRVEVEDDGSGFDPAPTPGVGLASMRERTAELGGSLHLENSPTGAKVTVLLP
ncbi:sensor histidine kinase [Nocardioides daeguensis]|uniref:sensor histidine kinase n=1 Tax=Nocardioides daeguensis TaxID=908359 RepID=UPI001C476187|nr:ATP-binding protein [Nocardioides daeguensis]MBV6727093.1 hypothetical protein [Nocardioides daeguensis]MCR1771504.1 hypothetical protein [Nocardioides daeguensis]